MSKNLPDLTPVRLMSGRRSKPSMDLLVDNQRVLTQYATPKKESHYDKIRHHLDNISISTHSENSLKLKPGPKSHKRELIVKSKINITSSKTNNIKRKSQSPVINGSNNLNIEELKDSLIHTPYITLRLNKIDVKDSVIVSKENDISKKEDDDLPLAKVFPDFKPNNEETVEVVKSSILVLPPKKKIKFVNINQLNGVFNKPTSITSFKSSQISPPKLSSLSPNLTLEEKTIVVKVLSPASSPSKVDVLTMAKIPKLQKKSIINGTTESATVEKCLPEDINTSKTTSDVLTPPTEDIPSPPLIQKETPRRCVRIKCTNVAIDDFRWDKEFCSPDCAIVHSKYLLQEWLSQHYPKPISEMHI